MAILSAVQGPKADDEGAKLSGRARIEGKRILPRLSGVEALR